MSPTPAAVTEMIPALALLAHARTFFVDSANRRLTVFKVALTRVNPPGLTRFNSVVTSANRALVVLAFEA